MHYHLLTLSLITQCNFTLLQKITLIVFLLCKKLQHLQSNGISKLYIIKKRTIKLMSVKHAFWVSSTHANQQWKLASTYTQSTFKISFQWTFSEALTRMARKTVADIPSATWYSFLSFTCVTLFSNDVVNILKIHKTQQLITKIQVRYHKDQHMQNSMRKLKLTLTLTDTGGAVLTLMLGYRSVYITWQ